MKKTTKKLVSLLLCAVMAFCAVLPAFAAEQPSSEPTWQNTIESVTPEGEPFVKLKLTAEGYKITECTLPQRYNVVFKDGTSVRAEISSEPSHFIPLYVYETYFDVETPEGVITLYSAVKFYSDKKEAYFSVGQYVLEGSTDENGEPAAGSGAFEFPIFEEKCASDVDEGGFVVKVLYFFYSVYLKIENWIKLRWYNFRYGK
ncbi:MAG: hypothetical protein IJS90_05520 [Clostridia bacterium]|nr:hypothetical protein [Clostridia bacterium]